MGVFLKNTNNMKKIVFILILGIAFPKLIAQNVEDALRFAKTNQTGTARFSAMAGAFGALGGDFSSINSNPAGSAVFINGQSAITVSNANLRNKSNYFNTQTTENYASFDVNQAGAVWIFEDYNNKNNWKKIAVALNYENQNNFNDATFVAGRNQNNSVSNYFTSFANQNGGIQLSSLKNGFYDDLNFEDQQAFLGYQGYIINPVADVPNNTSYVANTQAGGVFDQQNSQLQTGYNGKLTFNIATQYKDFLYVGMNLNSHFADFRNTSSFFENNAGSINSGIKSIRFDNEIYTYGSGFSFQLGTIIKLDKGFRIGLSFESPTWLRLNDEVTQNLVTSGFGFGSPANPNLSSAQPDSNVIKVYKSYSLQTPSKFNASFAYVIAKKGILSFDYGLKDYSSTKIGLQNDSRNLNVNQQLSNSLRAASEFRVGAEYKVKQLSLRGGYRFEESPFKDKVTIGDMTTYSAGLGYNFGDTKIDLSYSFSRRNQQLSFFSQGFTDFANINARNNTIALTLLFEM